MELSQHKEALLKFFDKVHDNKNLELEVVFRGSKEGFQKSEFEDVLHVLRGSYPCIIEESLAIQIHNTPLRFTIRGNENIKLYCKTNKITKDLEKDTIIEKKTRSEKPIIVDDYNFRVNLKNEEKISFDRNDVRRILRDWDNLDKTFRYKKRYSFLTNDSRFQYDLTVVKSSISREVRLDSKRVKRSQVKDNQKKYVILPKGIVDFDKWWYSLSESKEVTLMGRKIQEMIPKKSIRAAKVFTNPHNFEMELEYLGTKNSNEALREMVKYCGVVLQRLQKNYFLLSEKNKKEALKDYKYITGTYKFNGPQPITLERNHVVEHQYDEYNNVLSIRRGYSVTDKADGERNLLLIDSMGDTFLINRKNVVKSFGCRIDAFKNTILDGEYIMKFKNGKPQALFMAFDIYYYRLTDVSVRPLYRNEQERKVPDTPKSRLELLHEIRNMIQESSSILKPYDKNAVIKPRLLVKDFYFGDADHYDVNVSQYIEEMKQRISQESDENIKKELEDTLRSQKRDNTIFNHCDYVLSKEYPYHIDGLIFTPISLKVNQEKFDKNMKDKKGGRWASCFKWKPASENSIDFRARFITTEEDKHKITYKKIGDTTLRMKSLVLHVGYNPQQHTKHNACRVLNEGLFYEEEYKDTPFLPTVPYIKEAHLMHVEMDNTNSIRCEDKTVIQDGDLVECRWDSVRGWIPMRIRYNPRPNDFATAINVWKSIHYPVTENMIMTGNINKDEVEHIYYKNIKKRDSSLKPLSDFHSFVKKSLIKENAPPGSIMLDMSVGKGGDLNHWLDAGLSMCVGIDVNQDNLMNQTNGACNRVLSKYVDTKDTLLDNILLVWGDSSKSLQNYKTGNDNLNQYYLDIVYGKISETDISSSRLRKFYNIGNVESGNGFDVVSCQFSFHYFFKNESSLRTFFENVSQSLKVGGKFIGTCLDGQAVYRKLRENDGMIMGKDNNKLLWKITKKYDTQMETLPNTKDSLGMEIEVFMETIGSSEVEYLVNFEYVEKLAETYNMKFESIQSFEHIFPKAKEYGKAGELSSILQLYSFMNRKFILIKTA